MANITSITVIDGKKLTKAHANLLAKLETKHGVTMGENAALRVNPYTGANQTLCPLAVALYDFIIDSYNAGRVRGATLESLTNPRAVPTATWDAARYFFLTYWPDAYYSLID